MLLLLPNQQLGGSSERQYAPLQPGYAYFLTADVSFEPVYTRGILGTLTSYPSITDWNFRVIGTTVTKTDLDWFSRQQAEIRYTVKIDSSTTQVIRAYETDLKVWTL